MIGLHTLHIKPALLHQLGKIDEFKGFWSGLDDHTTGLNLLGDVASHGVKLRAMLAPLQNKHFNKALLCGLHSIFEPGPAAGQLKTSDNMVEFRVGENIVGELETATPDDAALLFEKLLAWVDEALLSDEFHPLLVIAVFTSVFLQIAPFQDGNLRLSRFLIILLMLKSGYRYAPFSSLDHIFNEHTEEIYHALEQNQTSLEDGTPDWHGWLTCFVKVLSEHKDYLADQLESGTKAEDIADMPALSIAILETLRANKRMTMKQIMKQTRGCRSTIKLRLAELLDSGQIIRHGAGRGVWYGLS